MTPINLIPPERARIRRYRRHLRSWALGAGGYALLLVIVLVVSRAAGAREDGSVRTALAAIEADRSGVDAIVARLEETLRRKTELLRANLEIAHQPDWGILLAVLADTAHDRVVLRRCRLAPARSEGPSSADGPDATDAEGRFLVQLEGMGRTQDDVSEFVLRLEGISLFRDVTVQDTRREPFFDDDVVAFRLDLALVPEGGATDEH